MNYKQQIAALSGVGFSALALLGLVKKSFYYVETGHMAFKFNKISGLSPTTFKEGYHLKIPVIEEPIIYKVEA